MTIFIATVISIYAVSLCFVAVLLTRALWHDRSTPLAPVIEAASTPAVTSRQAPLAELRAVTKSA